jgi:3',5'-cyclic AMP phosphodiesterase CpdA
MGMFTLAHLSDPHVPPLPRAAPGALLNKRLLGYLSWRVRRAKIHLAEILEGLTADLRARAPDHIVVTGDLVNISLPGEFEAAARWLGRLGPPDRVTVVPGNHDAYVALPWASSWRHWRDYMSSEAEDGTSRPPEGFDDFPLVRRRGPLALIGTSSALPTAPGLATGRLGDAQLARLEACLSRLGEEGRFRVVLVHHPPVGGELGPRKGLVDAAAFRAVIGQSGAELVLHGHDHRFFAGEIAGPAAPVPVFGVPSASAREQGSRPAAHYQLYRVEEASRGWRVAVESRGYRAESANFQPGPTHDLLVPRV